MSAVCQGTGNGDRAEVEERGRIRSVNGNAKAFSSPGKSVSVSIVMCTSIGRQVWPWD